MFFRVGIDNPTIEVRFENLTIDAEAYVGNRGIPTFTNFFSNKIMVCNFQLWKTEKFSTCKKMLSDRFLILVRLFWILQDVLSALHIVSSGKRPISIIHDISGVVKPGR